MPNRIDFYMDSHGKNSVLEYLAELANRRDKQSRVKHEKIAQQLDYLSQFGLAVGMPTLRPILGKVMKDLWELRPLKDRVLFVVRHEDHFVVLHHFQKGANLDLEVARAMREYRQYLADNPDETGEPSNTSKGEQSNNTDEQSEVET